jgi:adenylate cyclase
LYTKTLIGLGLGLSCALAALALGQVPIVRRVEMTTYDWRLRATADPAAARRDIVLVTIDEDSLRRLEPSVGRWPWPRLVHAQVLNFLARGPAKVVGYDVMFTERDQRRFDVGGEEWTGEDSDAALGDATAAAHNVVHIADAVAEPLDRALTRDAPLQEPLPGGSYRLDDSIEYRPIVTLPITPIAHGSRAIGHNFAVLDPDGPLRRSVPFIRGRATWIPSLAVATAAVALGVRPAEMRADRDGLWVGSRFLPTIDDEIPSYYGEHQRSRRALIWYRGEWGAGSRPTYRQEKF